MAEIRSEVGQWLKDKPALDHPGMRHLQVRLIDHEIPEQQNVDINCARTLAYDPLPSKLFLDFLNSLQKLEWKQLGFAFQHEIQEPGLVKEIARRSFVRA